MALFNRKSNSVIIHSGVTFLVSHYTTQVLQIDQLLAWLLAVNLVAFVSFGKDKFFSTRGWNRTPEATFHLLGIFGGFPGILLGRKAFHHKTIKRAFVVPMWILFVMQILAVAYFIGDFNKERAKAENGSTSVTIPEKVAVTKR